MRNLHFRPHWLKAESLEWQELWDKEVFKKWSHQNILHTDRVSATIHVNTSKRKAAAGEAHRFKARLILRRFEMTKDVDFEGSYSPTPDLAIGRLMLPIAVVNGMELHAIGIEQAFLQDLTGTT